MKKQYSQPELELKKLISMETVATGSGDNDIDIESDVDWGDFG